MSLNLPIQKDVSLAPRTVFRIGGSARFFIEAKTREDFLNSMLWARQYALPFFILGAGSNVLISEKGFHGLVVKPAFSKIDFLGNTMTAEAGAMMPKASLLAMKEGLSGFEWASGIPGTIGGSVRGNAGCFGSNTGDFLESVEAYDSISHSIKKFSNRDCRFSYRESMFKKRPELAILSATFSLQSSSPSDIQKRMVSYSAKRVETQAIGAKCAGCIFKNVPWDAMSFQKRQRILHGVPELYPFKNQEHIPTALLLDTLGLKGYSIGHAMISKKHANFFINKGGASSHEVSMLISHCKEFVHRKTGILLQEEIQFV